VTSSGPVRGVVLFIHRWMALMHQRLNQAGASKASTDEFNNAAYSFASYSKPYSQSTCHSVCPEFYKIILFRQFVLVGMGW